MSASTNQIPSILLPLPTPVYDVSAEVRRNALIAAHLEQTLSTERAQLYVLLRAPNGSVWKLSVDNSGAVTVAAFV